MNDEAGALWLERLLDIYQNAIWINPQDQATWDYYDSVRITRQIMGDRMFPLTLDGLERGMRLLGK
jgi:uncharacterized protein with von Willebrand factor type A (vWA) domain